MCFIPRAIAACPLAIARRAVNASLGKQWGVRSHADGKVDAKLNAITSQLSDLDIKVHANINVHQLCIINLQDTNDILKKRVKSLEGEVEQLKAHSGAMTYCMSIIGGFAIFAYFK